MTDLIAKYHAMQAARLTDRDKGATAVEYGLMVALITVVLIAAVTLLGDSLTGMLNEGAGGVGPSTP